MAHVTVLGAGVLGLTVAISAKALGHDVTIIARRCVGDVDAQADPTFASAFPAASIIPHTVSDSQLSKLFDVADKIYSAFRNFRKAGVRLQHHMELFEVEYSLPDYRDALREFKIVPRGLSPILRDGVHRVSGYSFDCFFCDMPMYGPWLVQMSEDLGISFERRTVTSDTIAELRTDAVVNCLGAGAHKVYEDIGPGVFFRGVLVTCPMATRSQDVTSYNYTPEFAIYPGFGGKAADVYFYPRTGHCVLGGTRQPGTLDPKTGAFVPAEPLRCEVVAINGVDVPRPIIDLNRQFVRQLTGTTLSGPFSPLIGYRHLDGSPSQPKVTIEFRSRNGMPPHIDCIGFGGAGVTLSWGAALRVLSLLESAIGIRPKANVAEVFVSRVVDALRDADRHV